MNCGLRIADCGLIAEWVIADCGFPRAFVPQSAIHNPQSAIRNKSAIRNPQSALRC